MKLQSLTSRNRQRGVAAIEMALIFPLLFLITYASVVYGYIYFLQSSVNFAAEEAARSAIAATPAAGSSTAFCDALKAAAVANFTAVQQNQPGLSKATPAPDCPGTTPPTFRMIVNIPIGSVFGSGQGFAEVDFPGIGRFPPVPDNIRGTAVIAVN